jgi:hypothetical protein
MGKLKRFKELLDGAENMTFLKAFHYEGCQGYRALVI